MLESLKRYAQQSTVVVGMFWIMLRNFTFLKNEAREKIYRGRWRLVSSLDEVITEGDSCRMESIGEHLDIPARDIELSRSLSHTHNTAQAIEMWECGIGARRW